MATVNEKMTAIADAIREKTGGTELLGLDAMAQAIAALETGGGLPEEIEAITSGTYASTTGYRYFYITHNMGVVPDFTLVFVNNASELPYKSGTYPIVAYVRYGPQNGSGVYKSFHLHKSSASAFAAQTTDRNGVGDMTETQSYVSTNSTNHIFPIGVKYIWVCGKFKASTEEDVT